MESTEQAAAPGPATTSREGNGERLGGEGKGKEGKGKEGKEGKEGKGRKRKERKEREGKAAWPEWVAHVQVSVLLCGSE